MPANTGHRTLESVLLAAAFALAHTQAPLYFSNQNQYFLHGLAAAGVGDLRSDWLANTRDPTPLFSGLVAVGKMALGEWSFQAAYFLLLGGYYLTFLALVRSLPGTPDTPMFRLAFTALFTAAHAALPRLLSVRLTGVDYPWYLQSGVAGQYLLGPGLQPSAFGVLLVVGLLLFARGRPRAAAAATAGAAVFHATYLLPAALLTLGYVVALGIARRYRDAVLTGMIALAVVAPVLVYAALNFAPTDPETFAKGQRVLAEVRIPHHTLISRWLDLVAWLQLGWAAVGLALLRLTPLFLPLLVATFGGVAFTIAQVLTGSDTLALLFPWRISAVLVPLATAVVAAHVAAAVPANRGYARAAEVVLLVLFVGGVTIMAGRLGYQSGDEEEDLYRYVREHRRPGDVYLLPVQFPRPPEKRGIGSNSFTPPPRPGSHLIAVDLQRFRLHTGAAVYVDFKSVPYRDVEVEEWQRRMEACQGWYKTADWDAAGVRAALVRAGVTHVVAPTSRPITAAGLLTEHIDPAYTVYRVRP
jgi:hypothetical protein